MAQPGNCPKCAGTMERGFTLDQGYGAYTLSEWVEGEPVKSLWTGIKLKGRTRHKIRTWRCRRCGYLESYAPEAG